MRSIKEKRCSVNLSALPDEELLVQKVLKDPYILPDGRILEIASEKFRAPEILFQPDKIGLECMCTCAFYTFSPAGTADLFSE